MRSAISKRDLKRFLRSYFHVLQGNRVGHLSTYYVWLIKPPDIRPVHNIQPFRTVHFMIKLILHVATIADVSIGDVMTPNTYARQLDLLAAPCDSDIVGIRKVCFSSTVAHKSGYIKEYR